MSRAADYLRNLIARAPHGAALPRTGPRAGRGGASSFHLVWESLVGPVPHPRLVEVSAVLEVVDPPGVEALYFWALQVDFVDDRGVWGGGHTGLQWNRRYPGSRAVNWGGYSSPEQGGRVLAGTLSSLPGFPDDPNTVAYAWEAGRPYRLRVHRSSDFVGAWRAEVTDLSTGIATIVRDLLPDAGRGVSGSCLTRPIVWSEVFADCESPSVTVRWSDLAAVDEGGSVFRPEAVRVNYQPSEDGGCSNTTALADEGSGFLQVTNVPRVVGQGARLSPIGSVRSAWGSPDSSDGGRREGFRAHMPRSTSSRKSMSSSCSTGLLM